MSRSEVNKYLVQFWQTNRPSCRDEDIFLGNGGIVRYSDGQSYLVTASHVAFNGLNQRNLRVTGKDFILFGKEVAFRRRFENDWAEMCIGRHEGASVLTEVDATKPLVIRGVNESEEFNIFVTPTYLGSKKLDQDITDLSHVDLSYGRVLHFEGTDDNQTIYHGVSGSLIFDNGSIGTVGLVTHGLFHRSSRFAKSGYATILNQKIERRYY